MAGCGAFIGACSAARSTADLNAPDAQNDDSPSNPDAPSDGSPSNVDPDAQSDAWPDTVDSDAAEAGIPCQISPELRPTIAVSLSDRTIESCAGFHGMGDQASRTLTGVVRDDGQNPAARTSLTIDTCAAGCNVVITTTGSIPFAVPVGAYVEAKYLFFVPFVCVQVLRISNLPEWNGQKNPVSDTSNPYLVVSSGLSGDDYQITGFSAEPLPVDCEPVYRKPGPCGVGPLRTYALQFSQGDATPLTVNQAEEAPWSWNGQSFMVRNHQSFDLKDCDNRFSWGFTIAAR